MAAIDNLRAASRRAARPSSEEDPCLITLKAKNVRATFVKRRALGGTRPPRLPFLTSCQQRFHPLRKRWRRLATRQPRPLHRRDRLRCGRRAHAPTWLAEPTHQRLHQRHRAELNARRVGRHLSLEVGAPAVLERHGEHISGAHGAQVHEEAFTAAESVPSRPRPAKFLDDGNACACGANDIPPTTASSRSSVLPHPCTGQQQFALAFPRRGRPCLDRVSARLMVWDQRPSKLSAQ